MANSFYGIRPQIREGATPLRHSSQEIPCDAFPADAILMLLLFVVPSLFGFYACLARWINQTIITLGNGFIRVHHRPLWWPGNIVVSAEDLTQVYVKEEEAMGEWSDGYELWAIPTDGPEILVLGGLQTSQQAVFIGQKIEEYLGVEAKPVPQDS